MPPKPKELTQAAHHVVYEYANLISAGTLLTKHLDPPCNTHVQDAFLLSCRKIAKFLLSQKKKPDDVIARDYSPGVTSKLPVWNQWKGAMDQQLAHITYTRVRAARRWDGSPNAPLLDEFRTAWRHFLSLLREPHKTTFQKEIEERLTCKGFGDLDLR
jgi:hypothetical protein